MMINESRWNGWNDGRMIDDCVGVLLSYLSLEDKLRLESVSKQWQRKIYWSVRYLCVKASKDGKCRVLDNGRKTKNRIDTGVLKMMIKKCHNIECVRIKGGWQDLNLQFLSVIADECEYLSHLIIYYNQFDEGNLILKNFFLKCGPKLKKLKINGTIIMSYYSVCVNLEELIFGDVSFVELTGSFSKLKSIEGQVYASQLTTPEFISFCDFYVARLKRIKLRIVGSVNKEELMSMFIQINKLVKLELISIELQLLSKISSFTASELNHLKSLTVWKKLNQIQINIGRLVKFFNSILQSIMLPFLIASHSNLESLKFIISFTKKIPAGSMIASISQFVCPKLKRLTFRGLRAIPAGFYQDLHLRFPNLTSLSIPTNSFDADLLIEVERLSQLKSLKIDTLDSCTNDIHQFFTVDPTLLNRHDSLRTIHLNTYQILSISRLQEMIKFASTIPSIMITFVSEYLIDDENQDPFQYRNIRDSLKKKLQETSQIVIPSNLIVYLMSEPIIMHGIII